MTFETPAIITSILMMSLSVLALALNRRSAKPAKNRTITITIEDSAGTRTRIVMHSNRRVDDMKRDFERLAAQPS